MKHVSGTIAEAARKERGSAIAPEPRSHGHDIYVAGFPILQEKGRFQRRRAAL